MISFHISVTYIASDNDKFEVGEVFYKQERPNLLLDEVVPALRELFSGIEFPIPMNEWITNDANEVIGFSKYLFEATHPVDAKTRQHVLALVKISQVDDSPDDLIQTGIFQ